MFQSHKDETLFWRGYTNNIKNCDFKNKDQLDNKLLHFHKIQAYDTFLKKD